MTRSIALGLPHTPWIPIRGASFERLTSSLGLAKGLRVQASPGLDVAVFDERESNKVWPRKMWTWGHETGAEYFLTLQDDVMLAPNFWPALRAMLEAIPRRVVLGLSAVSPLGPEVARQGHRFYATESHLVGWAYLMDRATLGEFLAWQDATPDKVAAENEDQLLNSFVTATGRRTWHPVPTLCDHDVSLESTYGNNEHAHRRSTVTWHGYAATALEDPGFWAHNGAPPVIGCPLPAACLWCGNRQPDVKSPTGAGICKPCVGGLALGAMGLRIES